MLTYLMFTHHSGIHFSIVSGYLMPQIGSYFEKCDWLGIMLYRDGWSLATLQVSLTMAEYNFAYKRLSLKQESGFET